MRGQAPEAVFAQGAAALEAQDLVTAASIFRALVAEYPELHAAWNALGVVALRAGDPDTAVAHGRRALELERRNPVYLNNLAVALGELGELAEAESVLRRALKLRPVYAEGLFNLGKVLHKQQRLADSLRAYERAFAMDAGFPGARLNLAQLHVLTGQAKRALEIFDQGRAVDDLEAVTYADALGEAAGERAAVQWQQGFLSRTPNAQRSHLSLSHRLLAMGRWSEGWHEYWWRTAVPQPRDRPAPLPADLGGRGVRLRAEQGLGDILFFLRFAGALRARGADVLVECPARLRGLLSGRADFRVAEDAPKDLEVWMGDLPYLLQAQDTPPPLSLACAPAAIEQARVRLASLGNGPYLALAWRAGTDTLRQREHGNVLNALSKEVPLAELAAAMRGWPGTLVSLQRNPREQETQAASAAVGTTVHDLSGLNSDLPALLALLASVDEYVTVSNTNIHLHAGLGKRSRVLVPHPAEWRWMAEGEGSPWFPQSRVYRQSAARTWREPLQRLRADLRLG